MEIKKKYGHETKKTENLILGETEKNFGAVNLILKFFAKNEKISAEKMKKLIAKFIAKKKLANRN